MTRSRRPTSVDPEERLHAVARILAEAILRRRLRQFRPTGRRENCLELSDSTSAHVDEPSRTGEDR